MIKKIINRKLKKFFSMKTLFVIINLLFVLSELFLILFANIDDVLKCILFLTLFLVFKSAENLLYEINDEKNKIIRVNKRFTHKNDETGAIEVKKEDLQQAILLLYELENNMALRK